MAIFERFKEWARRFFGLEPKTEDVIALIVEIVRFEPMISIGNLIHLATFATKLTTGGVIPRDRMKEIVSFMIYDGTLETASVRQYDSSRITRVVLSRDASRSARGGKGES